MTSVDQVLARLEGATGYEPRRQGPDKWMTRCPHHDDRDPSLSVSVVENGAGPKVLLHCFAGCDTADVLDSAGLVWTDLFADEPARNRASASTGAISTVATYAPTDLGNAERLAAHAGSELRYSPGLGWLVWLGGRFVRDQDGAVVRRAKAAVRRIYLEAKDEADDGRRKTLAGWAVKSEAEPRIRAAVTLAQSDARLVVAPGQLDAHPMLLNVRNGTVDLTTGRRRGASRDDLMTKRADVEHNPDAADPMWAYFLQTVTGGDAELGRFLARAVGYSLTGDTGEEVLFFAHGPEATGKSTFLEAIKATLGDYATTADFEVFLRQRDTGPRADVARLAGARFVTSQEVDDGRRLAEGLVKQLTGGDTVAARHLYRDTFEFRPQLKLWLAANARPRVSADDGAMWRRIVQVPFTVQVPEKDRDPDLKRHLTTDPWARSTILNWALGGCLEWQKSGLGVPEKVRDYTAEYRAENDPLRDWLDGACVLAPEAVTAVADLRSSYENWCEQAGDRPISGRAFGNALRQRGCEPERTANQRAWSGIRLKEMTQ